MKLDLTNLFNVETLDARFDPKTGEPLATAQPSKWKTPEYYLYYAVFLTIPPLMTWCVYDVSQSHNSNYKDFERLLSKGWIPGRKVDNSDAQYRSFRDNIPYMALVLMIHPLLRRLYESVVASSTQERQSEANATEARLQGRVTFDLAFAAIFLTALHGISAVKIFTILWINYKIATALPKQYVGVATWIFNIGLLFANELSNGYQFAWIASYLLPPQTTAGGEKLTGDWATRLDSLSGLIPRWHILFNITVLRLIAFNFDYLWSQDRRASSPIEVCLHSVFPHGSIADTLQKKNLDPTNLSERDRTEIGAKPSDFTFRNYVAYILYSPLYLVGPIINFNDYIAQSRHPLPTTTRSRLIPYALRFAFCLLFMEVALHYLYIVAISKSNPDWSIYSPFQLSMLGYFNLHIIWLKLLLPWRFFRLWSLLDGVDPPENMVRCISNQPSTVAFWRGHHRSYNRWVLRYIYIPMGGSQASGRHRKARAALNYACVFTFVALWHDINLRLLIWGWLVVLFVLPEVLARMVFPARRWKDSPNQYRWLCGLGVAGNCVMMMTSSLVGFSVGVEGTREWVGSVLGNAGGRVFLVAAWATLFVGAQVMFEWRESERRRGVPVKF
ncbi:hypothetical protein LTR36_006857 [Oleoguttula mirabilis]|uniref:Glycerol uptake protein 1 n=1 Tax=Oleoguttula mirabilis TaxID=1507867 RepID=A0AAV9JBB3_9PEZI|nr:hypothetical protein LTR36_006857 [Oleoguttula mirabilis]